MLNAVLKTVTLESGTALDVYLKVALTDARVFLGTVGTKSYTCGHCGRRRMVKSSHADDVRALLVASKLCLECYESLTTDRPVAPIVSPVAPTQAGTLDTATHHQGAQRPSLVGTTWRRPVDDVKAPAAFPSRMAFQVLRTDEDLPTGQFAIRMRHLFTRTWPRPAWTTTRSSTSCCTRPARSSTTGWPRMAPGPAGCRWSTVC